MDCALVVGCDVNPFSHLLKAGSELAESEIP